MSKTRTVFRCQECGGQSPKWVGRCPSCGEWNTLVEEIDLAGSEALTPCRSAPRRCRSPRSTRRLAPALDRLGRARPGARRRAGPGLGDPGRRRARRGQVHAAAAGGLGDGQVGRPGALRLGRGVAPAGAHPGRAPRRAGAAALPGQRDRAAQPRGPPRPGRARPARGRLDPDDLRARASPPAPGSVSQVRECAAASRARGQGPGRGDRAGRPRHQGRWPGRSARARAHRRHGGQLRGRPPPRPAPAPGGRSTASARPTSSACSR